MQKKKYKVMAYIMSSGLWDAFGSIDLESMLGSRDEDLSAALKSWQAMYDDQFRKHAYSFDWTEFNRMGEELTRRIRERLPHDAKISYEPSDDREFFNPEDCRPDCTAVPSQQAREMDLRERKRSLLYENIAWG